MSEKSSEFVFVYGTLKRGQRNHHILESGEAEFISDVTTKESNFLMHVFESVSSPGKFTPGVFLDGMGKISGELYKVDEETLKKLDLLEAVGDKYDRISVDLANGIKAWIYIERPGNRNEVKNVGQIEYKSNIYTWK